MPLRKGWLSGLLHYEGIDLTASWFGLPWQFWKTVGLSVGVILLIALLQCSTWGRNDPDAARRAAVNQNLYHARHGGRKLDGGVRDMLKRVRETKRRKLDAAGEPIASIDLAKDKDA